MGVEWHGGVSMEQWDLGGQCGKAFRSVVLIDNAIELFIIGAGDGGQQSGLLLTAFRRASVEFNQMRRPRRIR